jgi:hypothetical protein
MKEVRSASALFMHGMDVRQPINQHAFPHQEDSAMKTTMGVLIALASQAALAQVQTLPQVPENTPAQSDYGMPPQPGISSPSSSDTPAASGTAGTSGTSGTESSTRSSPGTDASSGAPNGMQSEAGMELRAAQPVAQRLTPVIQQDVTYLCGGVGKEEVTYMKKEAKGYDLMLTFAARDGAYLADVDVDIKNAKGDPVLQAKCDGPLMLVDLPKSGSYRVHAEAAGYAQSQTVKVTAAKKKGQHLASTVLAWPQQVAEIQGPAPTSGGTTGNSGPTGAAGSNNGSR